MAPAQCPAPVAGLAVAYSGGPDSTALLHALARASYPQPLRVLHVCHNLQAEARQWVAHCRSVCADLGVAFTCLDVQVDVRAGGVEGAARNARYSAFANALRPNEALVLAQHADDQAETFLLQALRGAGVAGLAGMPAFAPLAQGYLWRPLLALSRAQLQAYVTAQQLHCVTDPSNRDPHLARGYLRERLWPQLVQHWPQASTTLGRSAHWCAQAAALVREVAASDAASIVDAQGRMAVTGLRLFSPFRQGEALRHWLAAAGFEAPDHRHVEAIRNLLVARQHASPRVRWGQTEVRLFDAHLYALRPLPAPPGNWRSSWSLAQPLLLPAGCGCFEAVCSGQAQQALIVAFRRGGERFVDPRRAGTRTLKRFLQEARVPPWQRPRLPLVYIGDELVAIADYWQHPALAARLRLTKLRLFWRRCDNS